MRHVMSYTIAAGKSFNMVLSHPETSDPATWRQGTELEDMRNHFEGWDHRYFSQHRWYQMMCLPLTA
jgi:salicylate hydroxylase